MSWTSFEGLGEILRREPIAGGQPPTDGKSDPMVAGPTTGEDEPPAIDADGKDQQTIENHRDRGYHQFASPR